MLTSCTLRMRCTARRFGLKHTRRSTRFESTKTPPYKQPSSQVIEAAQNVPLDIPSQLWYHRLGPVTQALGWFHRTQSRRPLTIQLCTTTFTYLCGDFLAQDIGGEPYDGRRTLRMLTIGLVASIPGYKWFMFLGNHFNYASKWVSITVKVVVQQVVFAPVFNTYFFSMQGVLSGDSPSEVLARIEHAVPISIINGLKLWPAVTAFSFAFVMPAYRFMFSGIFAVCWQTYLSFLNRRAEQAGAGLPSIPANVGARNR